MAHRHTHTHTSIMLYKKIKKRKTHPHTSYNQTQTLSWGVKISAACSFVSSQNTRVADGQTYRKTDGQTEFRSQYSASIAASREKKKYANELCMHIIHMYMFSSAVSIVSFYFTVYVFLFSICVYLYCDSAALMRNKLQGGPIKTIPPNVH